jgi:hypothetical protein
VNFKLDVKLIIDDNSQYQTFLTIISLSLIPLPL